MDNASIFRWMDSYCRTNPLRDVAAVQSRSRPNWRQKSNAEMSRTVAPLAAFLLSGCLLAFSLVASRWKSGARAHAASGPKRGATRQCEGVDRVPVLITRSWFLGYSPDARCFGQGFLKGTDSDSIVLWLDNYCRADLEPTSTSRQHLAPS